MNKEDRFLGWFILFFAFLTMSILFLIGTAHSTEVALWCAWTDWSAHSRDKCAVDRATCEKIAKKRKLGDCTNWLG